MSNVPVYLSLGAGVQSTTLALMAAAGEITPMPQAAIFADTQWEPRAVYEHLARLEKALPFPVVRVTAGNLRESAMRAAAPVKGEHYTPLPWHVKNVDGTSGMNGRHCTSNFKIVPVRREVRKLMLAAGARAVTQWIGISLDEAHRMKESGRKYITHQWPLIDRRMTRNDCLRWLEARGWTVPKSACIGCPFHGDAFWRDLRDNHPDEWSDAVDADATIRTNATGMEGERYIHRSLVPLAEVDLSTDTDRGQLTLAFGNECTGMCGN